jgi:hypothetical protein
MTTTGESNMNQQLEQCEKCNNMWDKSYWASCDTCYDERVGKLKSMVVKYNKLNLERLRLYKKRSARKLRKARSLYPTSNPSSPEWTRAPFYTHDIDWNEIKRQTWSATDESELQAARAKLKAYGKKMSRALKKHNMKAVRKEGYIEEVVPR